MRLALGFVLSLLLFVSAAHADKRVALVIGNSAYANFVALPNASNDALAMTKKLQELGFEVVVGIDVDLQAMKQRLQEFEQKLPDSDIAALFYSGHGFQIKSTAFIVPIDSNLGSDPNLNAQAISVTAATAAMSRLARVKLVFLDCNRDNPFKNTVAVTEEEPPPAANSGGTLLAFATEPGGRTFEGSGTHTPFTAALLKYLGTPGQEIMRDMAHVKLDVFEATDEKQTPWMNSTLQTEVILKPAAP
jgi:uncharacterized caspase-like protein